MATKKTITPDEDGFELELGSKSVKDEENTEEVTKPEKPVKKVEKKVEQTKKYNPEDLIPCRSLTSGQLFLNGERSRLVYQWADYGDVVDVEVRDLDFLIKSNRNVNIYGPRFIIQDDEFVSQYPELVKFYSTVFSIKDLMDIVDLPIPQMRREIEGLPETAKNNFKNILSTMIDNHTLDSVQKIKFLDEILGTQLLLTLVQ